MEEVIGNKTLEVIEKEKRRYNRLLTYLQSAYCAKSIDENLRYLINLKEGEYTSRVDLNKSEFALKAYQLDEDVLLYDYLVKFLSSEEFYRALVVTSKNIVFGKKDFSLLDDKITSISLKPCIVKEMLTEGLINSLFADNSWTGSPFIVYGHNNIETGNFNLEKRYAEYHAQSGKCICRMSFTNNPECIIMSEDGYAYNSLVEDWIRANLDSAADPTMLVKMAGYYYSADKLKKLVRKL